MDQEQLLKNLTVPRGTVDVVLDTDAYNEIDDQFAISYMLLSQDKLCVKGICAAPFLNSRAASPGEGMEKSYAEVCKLLRLAHQERLEDRLFRGSREFLRDEQTPVLSEAASFLVRCAREHSPGNPLYIIAIGAITNVASALLLDPAVKENCVVIWLGGHGVHMPNAAAEFNMRQDIAAARVVFGCGVPLVQLPCGGVVDRFATSKYELAHWLKGKNALCDYLYENAVREAEPYAAGKPWTRVIWDVTAVAWLLDTDSRFMQSRLIPSPIPEYDRQYTLDETRHPIRYVYRVDRDALFADLFQKLGGAYENL